MYKQIRACEQISIVPTKPLSNLKHLKEQMDTNLPNRCEIAIIGCGAAGVELSLAIQAAATMMNMDPDIQVFERNARILPGFSDRTKKYALAKLKQETIQITCNFDPLVSESDGQSENSLLKNRDLLVWATGSRAGNLFVDSQLPVDSKGFLQVDQHLQSTAYPNIFGAGDCISLKNYPQLRKVGVYAIRQAPILCSNIYRYLIAKSLRIFTPQIHFLSILSTSRKTGIMQWGPFTFSGRMVWLFKNAIDRRFIRRYQE